MTHIKTYKFKLVPTKAQEEKFSSWLGGTRFVYNLCLDYRNTVYNSGGGSITKNNIQKELKDIKNETDWLKDIHSQVLQETTDRLYKSFDNFFRRVKAGETPGYPKFARKDFWSSFTFKQGTKVHPNTNRVSLPKISKVKFRKSQDILGEIKTATIKKESSGWFVCITAEVEKKIAPYAKNVVGLDLGLKDLLITSDGDVKPNPRTLRNWSKKLAASQRSLSRKRKGSNNRNKEKLKLQRIHQKIKEIRKDHLHKLTTNIISENQVVICENLNAKGMLKNHKLAKSISDASWGQLVSMLEYKASWSSRVFIKVPAHYTSQDCNNCGWRHSELKLSDREWICQGCGATHDRDINAARNIRDKGIEKLKEAGHVFSTFGDIVVNRLGAEEPHGISSY